MTCKIINGEEGGKGIVQNFQNGKFSKLNELCHHGKISFDVSYNLFQKEGTYTTLQKSANTVR